MQTLESYFERAVYFKYDTTLACSWCYSKFQASLIKINMVNKDFLTSTVLFKSNFLCPAQNQITNRHKRTLLSTKSNYF